jgi:MFS family permease
LALPALRDVADGGGDLLFLDGILSAGSQLAAAPIARRFGLLNTMVYTHIPSSVFLIAAALSPNVEVALAFLLLRSALSQMDVPTRSAYVMAVVTPPSGPPRRVHRQSRGALPRLQVRR